MKRIFLIDNFADAFDPKEDKKFLSEERLRRLELLSGDVEKKRFAAAEKITLKILSSCFGIENAKIRGRVSQRPYISDYPDISFSRSYCGNTLCVAAEDSPQIGVDSEIVGKADFSVMKYFFTENEKNFVEKSADNDLAFSIIWTRKESFIKCLGKGLEFPIHELDVAPKQIITQDSPIYQENDEVRGLYINSYIIGKTVISMCSQVNDKFPACTGMEIK